MSGERSLVRGIHCLFAAQLVEHRNHITRAAIFVLSMGDEYRGQEFRKGNAIRQIMR